MKTAWQECRSAFPFCAAFLGTYWGASVDPLALKLMERGRLQARGSNGVAWELLFAGSLLAPWTSRQAEAKLPPHLKFGVVQYLEQALDGAKCPHGRCVRSAFHTRGPG